MSLHDFSEGALYALPLPQNGLTYIYIFSFGIHIFRDKTLQLTVNLFKLIMNG